MILLLLLPQEFPAAVLGVTEALEAKHRLVYQVLPEIRTVKVLRLWTHYE